MKRLTAKGSVFPLSQYFIFSLCLSLVAGLLVSGGCVTESIVVGDIVFDAGNPVVEVTLHPGESIQLQLEENPSSGYLWLVEPGRNAAVHSPSRRSSVRGPSLTRDDILSALATFDNNRTKTAQHLGVSRRYLQYKIKEYNIPARYQRED